MVFLSLSDASTTALLVVLISVVIMHRARAPRNVRTDMDPSQLTKKIEPPTGLTKNLALALPGSILFPHDSAGFKQSMESYWAQQECEVTPTCIFQPRDSQEVSIAVTILKDEFDTQQKEISEETRKSGPDGFFAIRSGGHSPVSGAASIRNGVLFDLSLLCEVTPAKDGSSVVIGPGAKWGEVYRVLDEKGLAVAGGRNSDVGVGGLILGGKHYVETLLFFQTAGFLPSLVRRAYFSTILTPNLLIIIAGLAFIFIILSHSRSAKCVFTYLSNEQAAYPSFLPASDSYATTFLATKSSSLPVLSSRHLSQATTTCGVL